jgi:hypothetical protein
MDTTPRVNAVDKARRWTAGILVGAGLATGGFALHLADTLASTSLSATPSTTSSTNSGGSFGSSFGSTGSLSGSTGRVHTTTRGS